jgi:hypothetical protein
MQVSVPIIALFAAFVLYLKMENADLRASISELNKRNTELEGLIASGSCSTHSSTPSLHIPHNPSPVAPAVRKCEKVCVIAFAGERHFEKLALLSDAVSEIVLVGGPPSAATKFPRIIQQFNPKPQDSLGAVLNQAIVYCNERYVYILKDIENAAMSSKFCEFQTELEKSQASFVCPLQIDTNDPPTIINAGYKIDRSKLIERYAGFGSYYKPANERVCTSTAKCSIETSIPLRHIDRLDACDIHGLFADRSALSFVEQGPPWRYDPGTWLVRTTLAQPMIFTPSVYRRARESLTERHHSNILEKFTHNLNSSYQLDLTLFWDPFCSCTGYSI